MNTIFMLLITLLMSISAFFQAFGGAKHQIPKGALRADTVVLTELFTGELIKKLRFIGSWFARIPEQNNYVNNNVIHLVDVGADPDVLINNTTYPIPTVEREDGDVAITLFKYDTKNTKITDDELYARNYDKIGSVVDSHIDTLNERIPQHGLHSLAPSSNTTETPIIPTTGADDGTGRKRLRVADIAAMKKEFDDLKIPKQDRIGVLCTEHVNDLLVDTDQSFRDRYYNTVTGNVIPFLGFEFYEDVYNPIYNASNVKKAFAAAPAGTDRNASVFMYAKRAFRARGTTSMYFRDAKTDPDNRETKAGFRTYAVALPKKNLGFGAIVSVPTA